MKWKERMFHYGLMWPLGIILGVGAAVAVLATSIVVAPLLWFLVALLLEWFAGVHLI